MSDALVYEPCIRALPRDASYFCADGELGSSALLLRYGFVVEENPFDFVTINETILLDTLPKVEPLPSEETPS